MRAQRTFPGNRRPVCRTRQLLILMLVCLGVFAAGGTAAQAAGDANQESCEAFGGTESSPGFRSFLPDCRAYELVTPTYAGGSLAVPLFKTWDPPMSPDGNHLLGVIFAGVAGTEGNEQNRSSLSGAAYEFSRTGSGWTTEALNPPTSQWPRSFPSAGSQDLSKILWELLPPGAPGEEIPLVRNSEQNNYVLAVRERTDSGGGTFQLVGPMAAPGHLPAFVGSTEIAGASAELNDIFLRVYSGSKQLWPGDQTREGDTSLYEYRRGHGSEPVLVGVLNNGELTGTPVNEHAELASECGIRLGADGSELYNAVSADGETVFFSTTPCNGSQTTELYARLGATRTVDISEPAKNDCTACELTTRMAAAFQGASEDGSKAFFTSQQQLLPNAEGNSLYEFDSGAPEGERIRLVAPEVPAVARVSEDGTRIYFESTSVLSATPNGAGEAAEAGGYNLYAYDTATSTRAFVANLLTKTEAELLPPGQCGLNEEPVECATRVSKADRERQFDTTRDGSYLLFPSARHLTGPEDTSTVDQLFEYNAATGALVRVSAGAKSADGYVCPATGTIEAGYECDGNVTSATDAPEMVLPHDFTQIDLPTDNSSQLSLAGNGMVVFESRARLTPQAVSGSENVYEYRAGNVYLISPGTEPITTEPDGGHLTRLMGTDLSGENIFFFTTENLVPQDSDTQSSWYDARIGGGFPAPTASPECEGDSCQGQLAGAPPSLTADGTAVVAPGDDVPPPTAAPPPPRRLTAAQQLARALVACNRYRRKARRSSCDTAARKRYRRQTHAKKGNI